MKSRITRRALCAGLATAPVAMAVGGQSVGPVATAAASTPPKDLIGRILATVAADSGLPIEVILSPLRTRESVAARQKGLYLAYVMSGKSLPEIGRRFGGRDHTTVLHAVRKIGALRDSDPALRAELSRIARTVDPSGTIRMTWHERGGRKADSACTPFKAA